MNYVLTLVLNAGGVNETFVPLCRNVQSRLGERFASLPPLSKSEWTTE